MYLLKPFGERKDKSLLVFDTLKRLNAQMAGLKNGVAFAVNPPSIPGLGTTGGFEFYMQNQGSGEPRATDAALQAFLAKARARTDLQGVNTTFRASSQQLFVDLDRNKAEVLGVHVGDVFQTMQAYFGSQVVGQFSQFSRVWFVIAQADAEFRATPEDFNKVYVRSASGANVPLSALITIRYVASPKLVTRFNGFPAVKITGNQAPGYSSGEAIVAMEDVARETLPGDFSYAWAGQALQEKGAGGTSSTAFIFGLIVVFLLLAAQFEKWTLPVAVVLTVPFAVLGALLLTWALGLQNDVYFQVGLVTLVGLAAKNAILICEVAIEHVRHGMAPREAAIEAAGARLRAIVMTSFAFILGCVPLAIATGPGANSLRAIGTGVIGGMLASTIVAIFFVPLFFWLLESMSQKLASKKDSETAARQSGRTSDMRRSLSLLLAGLLVTGCTVGPDYQRPAVEVPRRVARRPVQGRRDCQHGLVGAVRRPRAQHVDRNRVARKSRHPHCGSARRPVHRRPLHYPFAVLSAGRLWRGCQPQSLDRARSDAAAGRNGSLLHALPGRAECSVAD